MYARPGVFLAIALTLVLAVSPSSQQIQPAPIPHDSGQGVTPAFEGWYRNADGTFTLSFGYFNRNYREALDIPIGANNRFDPGPADQGQPTHFLARRQTGIFTIVVLFMALGVVAVPTGLVASALGRLRLREEAAAENPPPAKPEKTGR